MSASAIEVVQTQLERYNARDLAGWLATYAEDAEQFTLDGQRLARGHAEIADRLRERFADPALHAELLARTCFDGRIVVDHERVRRHIDGRVGTVEMLCLYEVEHGRIRRARFAVGAPTFAAR